ncbi:MAG: hypothetical protein U9Q22_04030 [Candidatus Altiarchaeota archaeon]|nr:hypothetical protein [Candidatus Altiarchaeota archaeon]
MPLTPFHLGPALFFGLLFFRLIHLPTFLIANVIVDLEPFLVLFLRLDYPLHGFFHSLLGGSIIAIILSLIMIRLDEKVQKIMSTVKLKQKHSKKNILAASFTGIYLHILLDSILYTDIKPFFPLTTNPFYNDSMFAGFEIYGFCVISFILGIVLYGYRLLKH